MRERVAVLFLILFTYVSYGETILPDTISNVKLTRDGNPYIVGNTVTIRGVVTIERGCVFLFQPFSGFVVEGKLIVNGSKDSMVIFTSINKKEYNPSSEVLPNPFDWNGILISNSGCGEFRNFELEYSVYGIRSSRQEVVIENGIFRSNGQYHFSIDGKLFPVIDKLSFSYNVNGENGRCIEVDERRVGGGIGLRKGIGIGVGVTGLVVGVVGIYLINEFGVHYNRHKGARDIEESEREYRRAVSTLTGGIICSGLGVVGIGGGLVIYFSDSNGGKGVKRR